ncbi:hypothetical protein [Roseovarius pacificus]|uniref:hypothetical protein n=1 Tax=Roseovarius pacificus TaxID=337701 RepID=UPI002A18AE1D|nr:hypothetical protein [Roseovarius pacificus]
MTDLIFEAGFSRFDALPRVMNPDETPLALSGVARDAGFGQSGGSDGARKGDHDRFIACSQHIFDLFMPNFNQTSLPRINFLLNFVGLECHSTGHTHPPARKLGSKFMGCSGCAAFFAYAHSLCVRRESGLSSRAARMGCDDRGDVYGDAGDFAP